jgi:hypothetical protein
MNRREAVARLEEIRALMARTGEFRHLSGWALVANGALALAGAAASRWPAGVAFAPGDDPVRLAAVWLPVAALASLLDVLLTAAVARRRGEPAWSPAARQMVIGLLPGLYAGAVLTFAFGAAGAFDALPGAWMLCYGLALAGASHFTPWEIRYAGLAFLLAGGAALIAFRSQALAAMALGFGGLHLAFGAYVLWRYPAGAESAAPGAPPDPDRTGP